MLVWKVDDVSGRTKMVDEFEETILGKFLPQFRGHPTQQV